MKMFICSTMLLGLANIDCMNSRNTFENVIAQGKEYEKDKHLCEFMFKRYPQDKRELQDELAIAGVYSLIGVYEPHRETWGRILFLVEAECHRTGKLEECQELVFDKVNEILAVIAEEGDADLKNRANEGLCKMREWFITKEAFISHLDKNISDFIVRIMHVASKK